MAPENLAIFTRTTLNPRSYDSNQPKNHTKEKGEGKKESGGEKHSSHSQFLYRQRTGSYATTDEHRFKKSREI